MNARSGDSRAPRWRRNVASTRMVDISIVVDELPTSRRPQEPVGKRTRTRLMAVCVWLVVTCCLPPPGAGLVPLCLGNACRRSNDKPSMPTERMRDVSILSDGRISLEEFEAAGDSGVRFLFFRRAHRLTEVSKRWPRPFIRTRVSVSELVAVIKSDEISQAFWKVWSLVSVCFWFVGSMGWILECDVGSIVRSFREIQHWES